MIYFCYGWWVTLSAFFNLFFFFLSGMGTPFYYATDGGPAPSGTKRRGRFLGGFHNYVPHFSQTLVCIFYYFISCNLVRREIFLVLSSVVRAPRAEKVLCIPFRVSTI